MFPPFRLVISGLLLITYSFSYAQEKEKSGFRQTLERQARLYADFLSVYAATYAGEHNTQLESIQSQLMNKGGESLESKGYTADLSEIKELLSAFNPGSTLERSLLEFQNTTGLKVYLTGKLGGYGGNRIAGMFNELSYRKHPEQKVPPFLEVFATQQRDSTDGHYTLLVEVVPSVGVEVKRAADYFNAHFEDRKYESRSAARKHLKGVLLAGFADLKEKIGPAYLPPLSIKHEGIRFRNGDKIEIAQDTDGETVLSAVDKEDQAPDQKVKWTVFPAQGSLVSDHQIRLKTDKAGLWDVTAESGSHKLTVTLEVISTPLDFDEALKVIVREVLHQARQSAERAIARAEVEGDSLSQAATQIENEIYQGSFEPIHTGSEAFVSDEFLYAENSGEWLAQSEVEEIKKDPSVKKLIENQRLLLLSSAQLILQFKIEEFVMTLLDDPDSFELFLKELKEDAASELGRFIGQSIAGTQKESVKAIVTNYVNQRIEKIAHSNEEN